MWKEHWTERIFRFSSLLCHCVTLGTSNPRSPRLQNKKDSQTISKALSTSNLCLWALVLCPCKVTEDREERLLLLLRVPHRWLSITGDWFHSCRLRNLNSFDSLTPSFFLMGPRFLGRFSSELKSDSWTPTQYSQFCSLRLGTNFSSSFQPTDVQRPDPCWWWQNLHLVFT